MRHRVEPELTTELTELLLFGRCPSDEFLEFDF